MLTAHQALECGDVAGSGGKDVNARANATPTGASVDRAAARDAASDHAPKPRPASTSLTRRQLFARALPLSLVLAAPFAACRPAPTPAVRVASAPDVQPTSAPSGPVPTPGSYWSVGTPVPARPVMTNPAPAKAVPARSVPAQPLYPLAILVENHPDARPQSGLSQADVVYEALTEGGISRFLAVYLAGNATSIGPIRSARDYFVNIAAEYNASLVHIGSSPGGYEALERIGLRDLDETYGHPGFERIRARVAPHNAYTSTEAARAALQQVRGVPRPGSWGGLRFRRGGEAGPSGDNGRAVAIRYAPHPYAVGYTFDAATRRYARTMDGASHTDALTGEQLGGTKVVVVTVPSRVIDAEGRLVLDQVGTGKALVLSGGRAVRRPGGRGTLDKARRHRPARAARPGQSSDPARSRPDLDPGRTDRGDRLAQPGLTEACRQDSQDSQDYGDGLRMTASRVTERRVIGARCRQLDARPVTLQQLS